MRLFIVCRQDDWNHFDHWKKEKKGKEKEEVIDPSNTFRTPLIHSRTDISVDALNSRARREVKGNARSTLVKRKFTEPRNTWKFSRSVFGVDNSAACVHTRLCKLLESNWMMEDGLGGDLGSPFLSEGRVAPLSVALSVILHRVSQMRDGDLSEREFDARLFDSFSPVDEDSWRIFYLWLERRG